MFPADTRASRVWASASTSGSGRRSIQISGRSTASIRAWAARTRASTGVDVVMCAPQFVGGGARTSSAVPGSTWAPGRVSISTTMPSAGAWTRDSIFIASSARRG